MLLFCGGGGWGLGWFFDFRCERGEVEHGCDSRFYLEAAIMILVFDTADMSINYWLLTEYRRQSKAMHLLVFSTRWETKLQQQAARSNKNSLIGKQFHNMKDNGPRNSSVPNEHNLNRLKTISMRKISTVQRTIAKSTLSSISTIAKKQIIQSLSTLGSKWLSQTYHTFTYDRRTHW